MHPAVNFPAELCCQAGQPDRYRGAIHSWLLSFGQRTSTAAGIAGLLGEGDPKEIQRRARQLFLCVPLDRVTKADMADNKPNPALQAKSEPARMGEVDAFLTHSWHDDTAAKWAALQNYRRDFRQKNGREARLWIDK